MELLFLLPIFLPLLTAIFLFFNKNLFNELITNFFTLNSALLSFAISFYVFVMLALDKFQPINYSIFQWTNTPDIKMGFTLDGLSGIMLLLVTGLSFIIIGVLLDESPLYRCLLCITILHHCIVVCYALLYSYTNSD